MMVCLGLSCLGATRAIISMNNVVLVAMIILVVQSGQGVSGLAVPNFKLSAAIGWTQRTMGSMVPSSSSCVSRGLPSSRSSSKTTNLGMVRNRGLEVRRESATPTEGGMTLYLKAGPDGISVGDCPFAHFVRMVLEEKGLEYELKPCTAETKPTWLVEHYGGKMPALRHRKECYIESNVIADYLDFFFRNPPLQSKSSNSSKAFWDSAEPAVEGLFPRIAKYLKHVPIGDERDEELLQDLKDGLSKVEDHLKKSGSSSEGPYLTGRQFSLLDCSLAPKLYHLQIGLQEFKEKNVIDFHTQFPALTKYMDTVFARPSFQKTVYPRDVVVWGWSNARK